MIPPPSEAAPPPVASETIVATDISNREFLERYAQPGRVGLSGGRTLIDQAITRAQDRLESNGPPARWSHAFFFEGRRADDEHWVIESDLDLHRKHIRLGVQENRMSKYYNEELYTSLAVLDFGVNGEQTAALLREGLNLVADRTRYSLRELVGTWLAIHHPALRAKENLLAREKSLFCSAFVLHLFRRAGCDLTPGVGTKLATPEDLAHAPLPHVTWLLRRGSGRTKLRQLAVKLRRRTRARLRHLNEEE